VLFFTTDLDASYLHPSQTAWSRNLLVASSYGLSAPGPSLGSPFRDSYGPAIQRAVHNALADRPGSDAALSIFEIGRTEAHLLVSGKPVASEAADPGEVARGIIWAGLGTGLVLLLPACYVGPRAWAWCMAGLVAAGGCGLMLLVGRQSEPLAWLEGVSIWPTELIRMVSIVVAVLVLLWAERRLSANFERTGGAMQFGGMPPKPAARPPGVWLRAWSDVLESWTGAARAETGNQPEKPIEADELWRKYGQVELPGSRWRRVGILATVLLAVGIVSFITENPPRPCRAGSCTFDLLMAVASVATLLLLACYVTDVTATCTRWIRAMAEVKTVWIGSTVQMPGAWREVEIAARRTEAVSLLIVYPFVLLMLQIVSRFSIFDRWSWPASLLIIYAVLFSLAVFSAVALRVAAEQLRRRSYAEVRDQWVQAIGVPGRENERDVCERAMQSIEAEVRGAFSPLARNPVLGALMLPLGGAGAGLVLEKLLQQI
jgi:hypothetical protein